MKLCLDLDLSQLIVSEGMTTPLSSLRHKYGEGSRLEVHVYRSGVKIVPTENEEFAFVIKPVGEFADTAILGGAEPAEFTYDADLDCFVGIINYNVAALKEALHWDEDEELRETAPLWAELSWRPNSSAGWQRCQLIEDFRLLNVLFKGTETFPTPGTPIESGGPWLTPLVRAITSDVVNSTTTLADITDLAFVVESGKMYHFRAIMPFTTPVNTTGIRPTLTGPASPTFLSFRAESSGSTTRLFEEGNTAYNAPATAFASSFPAASICVLEGFIQPSADGTVQFRFASEVGASAVTIKAGACVQYTRLN